MKPSNFFKTTQLLPQPALVMTGFAYYVILCNDTTNDSIFYMSDVQEDPFYMIYVYNT